MSIDGLVERGPMRKHEGSMICALRSKHFEHLLFGGKLESTMSWRTAFKRGPGKFMATRTMCSVLISAISPLKYNASIGTLSYRLLRISPQFCMPSPTLTATPAFGMRLGAEERPREMVLRLECTFQQQSVVAGPGFAGLRPKRRKRLTHVLSDRRTPGIDCPHFQQA